MPPAKTATEIVVDTAGTSNRRQPSRRTRTKPTKISSALSHTTSARDALPSASLGNQPIPIFPAVMHFADTITALPKELVRHFTLLKEVDAKIFAPQEALIQLVDAALSAPMPTAIANSITDTASIHEKAVVSMSTQNSTIGYTTSGSQALGVPSVAGSAASTAANVLDPNNIARRQLFRQAAFKMSEMLVSLEEKNHVISTANDALSKQLARIDDVWPYLQDEFSDEAKWGSDTHWAYPENRASRQSNTHAEKTRREGAASLSAAAQALADEAAARSDARKQAVAAKKNQRNQIPAAGPEYEEQEGKGKGEAGKKTQKRKTVAPGESPANIGLGILSVEQPNGTAPKRRKVEKPAGASNAVQGSAMSSVFGKEVKTGRSASPRAAPAPAEAKKPRKALPGSSAAPTKKRAGPGAVSVASSPVIGTFGDLSRRISPPPTSNPRPSSSRARHTSTFATTEPRARPATSSGRSNGDALKDTNGTMSEAKLQLIVPDVTADARMDVDPPTPKQAEVDDNTLSPEDTKRVPPPATVPAVTTTIVMTKSGRTSKPSTPALGSVATRRDSNTSQRPSSRPSRHSETAISKHDSHGSGTNSNKSSVASTLGPAEDSQGRRGEGATPGHAVGAAAAAAVAAPPPPPSLPPAKRSHKKGASASAARAALQTQESTLGSNAGNSNGINSHSQAAGSSNGTSNNSRRSSTSNGNNNNNNHAPMANINHNNNNSSNNNNNNNRSSSKTAIKVEPPPTSALPPPSSTKREPINTNRRVAAAAAAAEDDEQEQEDDPDEDEDATKEEPSDDVDENEPRYCYCNGVSYGEMVGCDGNNCEKEWFHLECVGLRVAPKENVKWYCDQCKEHLPSRRR